MKKASGKGRVEEVLCSTAQVAQANAVYDTQNQRVCVRFVSRVRIDILILHIYTDLKLVKSTLNTSYRWFQQAI